MLSLTLLAFHSVPRGIIDTSHRAQQTLRKIQSDQDSWPLSTWLFNPCCCVQTSSGMVSTKHPIFDTVFPLSYLIKELALVELFLQTCLLKFTIPFPATLREGNSVFPCQERNRLYQFDQLLLWSPSRATWRLRFNGYRDAADATAKRGARIIVACRGLLASSRGRPIRGSICSYASSSFA